MRIWVGVHPFELDEKRILALHSEIHMMLGTIRNKRDNNPKINPQNLVYPITCNGWTDARGLAALIYLHNLVAIGMARKGFKEDSPFMIERLMQADAHAGASAITSLFKNRDHTALIGIPEKWPPLWITNEQKIADLKDLQARWRIERAPEYHRCVERYGTWEGGNIAGAITSPESITPQEVERYLAYREERKKRLAEAKNGG